MEGVGAVSFAREHRWVRLRLLGWALIGAWQVVGLASEMLGVDLMSRPVRIAGDLLGLVGLVLVALGFERVVEAGHLRAGEGDP